MRAPVTVLALLFASSMGPLLEADDVYLTNGRVLSGVKTRQEGGDLVIEVEGGTLRRSMADVERIESAMTPQEIRLQQEEERQAAAAKLAEAKRQALVTQLEASRGSAARLYETANWARERDYSPEAIAAILRSILALEPDHPGARQELGFARYKGEWALAAEARALEARDHAEEMRRQGFVAFDGRWMRADEARWQDLVSQAQEAQRKAENLAAVSAQEAERGWSAVRQLQIDLEGTRAELQAARDEAQRRMHALEDEQERELGAARARLEETQKASAERERAALEEAARRWAGEIEEARRQACSYQQEGARLAHGLADSESHRHEAEHEAESAERAAEQALAAARASSPDLGTIQALIENAVGHARNAVAAARGH